MQDTEKTTNDMNIDLTEEQRKKLLEASRKRAEAEKDEDDIGGAATKEEASEAKPLPKPRNIYLKGTVKVEVYDDKGEKVVNTLTPSRNVLEIGLILKSMAPDQIVSIYGEEDPAASDPPPDGGDRPTYPIFEITKTKVRDAIQRLLTQMVSEPLCLLEFQRLCDFMSFRSSLVAAQVNIIFKGSQPGAFSFFSSCSPVTDKDVSALYTLSKDQNAQYKEKVKSVRPSVKFPDDSGIITL